LRLLTREPWSSKSLGMINGTARAVSYQIASYPAAALFAVVGRCLEQMMRIDQEMVGGLDGSGRSGTLEPGFRVLTRSR
jgi:hypothetical protein